MEEKEPVSYTLLLIIIVVGVTIGNLLSAIITTKVIEHYAMQASAESVRIINEIGKRGAAQMQEINRQNAAAQERQQQETRSARENSPIARKLAQQCNDWTRAYDEIKSGYAKEEMTKRCSQLQAYINTGTAPR